MEEKNKRTFIGGRLNPIKYGMWPLRASAGQKPDQDEREKVASLMGRQSFFVDDQGYECEIIGAAINPAGSVAYVESRAKEAGVDQFNQKHIDISIKVHLDDGNHRSIDIESYNPYFGCDVRLFEWISESFILIYREKHKTYACRFGDLWPPLFVAIEDRWLLQDSVLLYIRYKENKVRRRTIPELTEIESITADEADQQGILPPEPKLFS